MFVAPSAVKHNVTSSVWRYLEERAVPMASGIWPPTIPYPPKNRRVAVEEVHRPSTAPGDTRLLAEQLGHDVLGLGATSQDVAVLAVVADDPVLRAHRLNCADDGRLFADIQMAVAADLGPRVHLKCLLLEVPDQHHEVVSVAKLINRFMNLSRFVLLALAKLFRFLHHDPSSPFPFTILFASASRHFHGA